MIVRIESSRSPQPNQIEEIREQLMRRNPGISIIVFALSFAALLAPANGDVRLHGLFGDNMVLQRDCEIPVWGTAAAGEKVVVAMAGQTNTTTADAQGKWSLRLEKLPQGGPYDMIVEGNNRVEIRNVMLGEVWLCSGQSNMAMTVARSRDAAQEIAAADFPEIRMFRVPRVSSPEPRDDVQGNWLVCDPKTVGGFSATAFFFGRKLHKDLNVPVGLINSSVGGTPIDFWTSAAAQETMFADSEVKKADSSMTAPVANAGNLYNGMIAPLAPYAIRGAIWYQGERNSKQGDPYLYRFQLPALVANWRRDWKQGDFPFYWVQLPNFTAPQKEPSETNGWVLVREGMLEALATPNTGMAVTIDVGEERDIHPKNKQDVGLRLALWALARTYGQKVVYSGPLFKTCEIQEEKVLLTFDVAGSALATRDNEALHGFAIAGEDRKFVWAEARITGDGIEVSSPEVPRPVAVRYAWASNPVGNLVNREGLPASPFRTDDWKE
jgi:sialate O-acetylesterase